MSNYKGIRIRKNTHTTSYYARITLNRKEICKRFDTLPEALNWRNSKIVKLHGNFAFNGIN